VVQRVLRMTVALVCLAGVAAPAGAEAAAQPGEPVRILVLGDSITQGSSGDWTWRYRLWQHLAAAGVPVDFVGHRDTVGPYAQGSDQDYVDTGFDRDHAAYAGKMWTTTEGTGDEFVARHAPDVVMVMLGVNDLVFGGSSPEEIRDHARAFIRQVQVADPTVDVVLGLLTPFAWADVRPTNDLLLRLPLELSTPTSQVVAARTDVGYELPRDTFDDVHPSANGEMRIAAAMADGLAQLGIGPPAPRPVPVVPNGPRLEPVLAVEPAEAGVRLRWWDTRGADGNYVWTRRADDPSWRRLADLQRGSEVVVTGADAEGEPRFRLQPAKGRHSAAHDIRSNVVVAAPPPRVRSVELRARRDGRVVVTWQAAARAVSYHVRYRHTSSRRWQGTEHSAGLRRVLGPLRVGQYVVTVRGRGAFGTGPFSVRGRVRVR
jgi:lysophospholipase L1-like esterase